MNRVNVPQLRFSGFDGEWEVSVLNKFASLNPKNSSLPESFIYIDLESVTNGHLIKENVISKNEAPSRAQRILKEKDILYQTVRPYQKNNLYFNKIGDYVASTGYAQIRTKNDSQYLFQFLHTEKFVANVMLRCTGTSYPAINSTDLSSIEISFPSLPEQQKIASFLSAVDEKIQQLSRKKQLLEQYKKGVMQQLFSGKLRFKDENGKDYADWEEKKLGEVAKFSKGKGISKSEVCEDGINECIRYGELYTRYGEVIQNIFSKTNFDINKAVISQANDVIIPASGETQIDIATASCVMKSGVILGGDLNIIRSKNNGIFLSYYLNSARKLDIANLAQGISVVHLYSSQLSLLNLSLPCLEEQQKIANFLSNIDVKIENTNQEINKMQNFKKGLLQQMFV